MRAGERGTLAQPRTPDGRATEQQRGFVPSGSGRRHSITSSARIRIVGGTANSMAFAVFLLMTR
jgi:hypothetical protein